MRGVEFIACSQGDTPATNLQRICKESAKNLQCKWQVLGSDGQEHHKVSQEWGRLAENNSSLVTES